MDPQGNRILKADFLKKPWSGAKSERAKAYAVTKKELNFILIFVLAVYPDAGMSFVVIMAFFVEQKPILSNTIPLNGSAACIK